MRRIVIVFCVWCCVLGLRAQTAGLIVSGTVSDSQDVLIGATVVELDESNRIIVATVTDINGFFSLKIKNPKDRLQFSYVGCISLDLPLDRTVYEVKLKEQTMLEEVSIVAQKKTTAGALDIPDREVSFAAQTISTEEFAGLGINSIDEALQGRIAGMDIVMNSGNLGSGSSIRLRGASSINCSSDPLIVVDGNVWENGDTGFDVSSANDEKFAELLNINPEDIESISVLKDAAATAIWGSQGSNGVIEIKTKRGVRGDARVTYSYRFTGTYQPEGMKMLNGDQYTMLLKESYFNPQLNDAAANIREINYDPSFSEYEMYNNNTDWRKAVTQFGQRHNHYLSVTGGGEKATFRIGAGYDSESGSVIGQNLQRFTTRVALDYYVSDRIKIMSNFSMTYTDNEKNSDDLLAIAYKKMPNLSIYKEDADGRSTGDYYEVLQTVSSQLNDQKSLVNPVASAAYALNRQRTYSIDPQLELQYKLLGVAENETQLRYNGKVVLNVYNNYADTFYPRELTTGTWNSGVNKGTSNSSNSLAFTTTHTFTFIPYFSNTDHSLQMLGRFQLVNGNSNGQNTQTTGLPSGGITSVTESGLLASMSTTSNQWRSMYYTFSTHYAYQSRYMADVSARVDGSTKFGPGNRWGFFPAVSLRWNVIDEPWMEKARTCLTMFSIRPGWGLVGHQPDGDFLYISKYATSNRYLDLPSVAPQNIRLSNLKWETKRTWNLGFDLGFLDDRLTMDVNLYSQLTTDLLMSNPAISTVTGYSNLSYRNVGSIKNNGWELNVNGTRVVNVGKFSMGFNLTFANNYNTITQMDESVLESLNSDFNRSNASYLTRVQLDNPFGAIYGFKYKGVYAYSYKNWEKAEASGKTAPVARTAAGKVILDEKGEPLPMTFCYGNSNFEFTGGDAIYEDINHDGDINELDIVYLGSSLPKLTGGFGVRLIYGRLSLNTQFNYRYGNKIINMARLNAESMTTNNNQSQAVNYRWRKEGDASIDLIPRAMYGSTSNYNSLGSDRFVEDGSFIRLNYMQLSYSVNPKQLKKYGFDQLSLYVSANNLFCLTAYSGVDPEVGYGGYGISTDNAQTPRAKSFTAGITLGF